MFNSIFDELELKEVKYFKETTAFKSVIMQKTRKKTLKSLQKAEAYLEPKRASTIQLFVNVLNGLLFSE